MIYYDSDSWVRFAEWLSSPPTGGPIQKWFVGLAVGPAMMAVGLYLLIQECAGISLAGRRLAGSSLVTLTGVQAIAAAGLIFSIGLFIHSQWFWGNHEKETYYYNFGKCIATVGFIISLVATPIIAIVF